MHRLTQSLLKKSNRFISVFLVVDISFKVFCFSFTANLKNNFIFYVENLSLYVEKLITGASPDAANACVFQKKALIFNLMGAGFMKRTCGRGKIRMCRKKEGMLPQEERCQPALQHTLCVFGDGLRTLSELWEQVVH